MKDHRKLAQGLLLLLTLLISGIGAALPAAASAMRANSYTYVSTTTGETVAWNAPWAYDANGSSTTAGGEVAILSSDIAITMIGFLPTGINMNQARDQVLAEFQKNAQNFRTLDRGSYSNVSYSLDMASIADSNGNSAEFGFFTLFLGNTGNGATEVQIFLAPVQVFTQGMISAKSSISVGGSFVFNGVTPGGLQTLLNRNAGSTANTTGSSNVSSTANGNQSNAGATSETPAAQGSNGLSSGDLQLGGNADNNAGNQTNPQASGRSGDSFTDPKYGYSVQWTNSWAAQQSSSGLTLTSDANGAIVLFDGIPTGGNSVAGAADRFPSAYVQSDKLLQNPRLGASTSGNGSITFIVLGTLNGTPVAEIVELIDQPDLQSAVMIRVVAPQATMATAAQAFQNDVTVNGQPVLTDLNNVVNNPLDAPSG